jgi:hypothetical protein
MKPVFYQDNAHTLFIEPNVEERTVEDWKEWVTRTPQSEPGGILADGNDYAISVVPKYKKPFRIDLEDPLLDTPFDSLANMKLERDWLVNPATGLLFEGEVIGPGGKVEMAMLTAAELSGPISEGGVPVNVHAGSELASGSAIVALASDALDQAGLARTAGTLNIVGGSGFNSALAQNFDALNRSGFGAGNAGELFGR